MSSRASCPSTNKLVTTVRRPAWVPRSASMPAVLAACLTSLATRGAGNLWTAGVFWDARRLAVACQIHRYAATPPAGGSVLRNAGTPRGQSHGRVRVLCGTPTLAPRGQSGAAVDAARDHRAPGPRHHAGYGVGDADLAPTIIEWAQVPSARRSKAVVVGRLEDRSGLLMCSWASKRYVSPEVNGTRPGQTQNSLPAFESLACRCGR
jgi:hypothetical protein